MTEQTYGMGGTAALVVAHCAGMLDLTALPVWVGALVERFGFSPQQAGGIVTLFLLGAVAASLFVAPRLNRINQKLASTVGYGVAALAFFIASTQSGLVQLAALHLVAGLAVGTGLSMVHGAIGKSDNPHRLFALAGMAIGLLGIVLLGVLPQLLIAFGREALFQIFGLFMAIACLFCAALFVNPDRGEAHASAPFGRAIWFTVCGISVMTFNQAMVFSFVEVIGKLRGFSAEGVLGVLIALGIVNFLIPSPLAAVLQKRLAAETVVQIGPAVQAVFAVIVTCATVFALWAPVAAFFVAIQIFTHTFAFGLLARLDRSGRAVAATPAMLMIGAALGPIAGGALGQNFGFGALGAAGVAVAILSIVFFTKARTA
ncbi:putative MFS family arabinose efflux permease [Agrobacterium pusense]|uniref:MFS transporter n=1 Tax=Agrobacterium pusense TaxID=648995 RepID=UPI0011524F4D|nr:MFS transporter [Agrobacterium pusense]MDR6192523.1 putative MFS family arabinose efflux permease [Agrobacterium pusense]